MRIFLQRSTARKLMSSFLAASLACLGWLSAQAESVQAYDSVTSVSVGEWWLWGGSAGQQNYSPLAKINDKNAGQLGLAWYSEVLNAGDLVGQPLIADEVAYVAGMGNIITAVDLNTGKKIWQYAYVNRPAGNGFHSGWGRIRPRGLALWEDLVIMGTSDCHVIGVSRKTGKQVWASPSCDGADRATHTGSPRVGDGKVFIGMAGSDEGARGQVYAFDAQTGKQLWRFNLVPRAGDTDPVQKMAAATWSKEIEPRGATPYDSMLYDPSTGLLYLGTGGPFPWSPTARGKDRGAELFTDSVVALNAKTGAYVWHYQSTPDNAWNYESTMPFVAADLEVGGKKRHVIMHAPKNGFFYVLDALTGKLVNEPKPYTKITWASRIDMKTGRPVQNPETRYDLQRGKKVVAVPGAGGGHGLEPLSFSPLTKLVYIPVHPDGNWYQEKPGLKLPMTGSVLFGYNKEKEIEALTAWDPVAQKARWSIPTGKGGTERTGVVSTAGNLVVFISDGKLNVVTADTGKLLKTIEFESKYLPLKSSGSPVIFDFHGEQMILLQNHGRLFAFKLGAQTPPPQVVVDPAPFPKPALPRFPDEFAEKGRRLYYDIVYCVACHGDGAVPTYRSFVPDLRKSSAATHAIWNAIVIDGGYVPKGMPKFGDYITAEEAKAIEAYVVNEAWKAYENKSTKEAPPSAVH